MSTNDYRGGAAKCAYQLAMQFKKKGHKVLMYVSEKTQNKDWIVKSQTSSLKRKLRHLADRAAAILVTGDKFVPFTLGLYGENIDRIVEKFKPDIINFHWTGKGFISFKGMVRLAKKYPSVRTLHDRASFTGGYFLDRELLKRNRLLNKLSRWNLNKKAKYLKGARLNLITPSKSLAMFAKKSSLFKSSNITVINNGIDLSVFKPQDKSILKRKYGLEEDRKYILFGAGDILADRAKGFDLLIQTLYGQKRFLEQNDIGLIGYGQTNPFKKYFKDLNVEKIYLDYISVPQKMAELYTLGDVYLFPSKTENYPLSVIESIACNTPVLGFRVGGIPEILSSVDMGILVEPFRTDLLGKSLQKLLKKTQNKIDVPNHFAIEESAKKYLKLFKVIATK